MSCTPSDSSGRRAGTPDPRRPLDSIPQGSPIPCPACRGDGGRWHEGATRPAVWSRCESCVGRRILMVFWACSSALAGVQHVVRVDLSPHLCLCGWTINREHLLSPQGLYCVGCLKAIRRVGLVRELDLELRVHKGIDVDGRDTWDVTLDGPGGSLEVLHEAYSEDEAARFVRSILHP